MTIESYYLFWYLSARLTGNVANANASTFLLRSVQNFHVSKKT